MAGSLEVTSAYSKDAVYINLEDEETTAESLVEMNLKLGGKKVIFYKEGENCFALPEEKAGALVKEKAKFWKHWSDPRPCFDNYYVGQKFADFFPKTGGKELQRKMSSSFFLFWSKKHAVDASEYLRPMAEKLSTQARILESKFFLTCGTQQEKSNGKFTDVELMDDKDVNELAGPVVTQLRHYSNYLDQCMASGQFDAEKLKVVEIELDNLQLEFWRRMQPKIGAYVHMLDQRQGQKNYKSAEEGLKGIGCSDNALYQLKKAGYADQETLAACNRWLGDAARLKKALLRAANQYKKTADSLDKAIQVYTKGSQSTEGVTQADISNSSINEVERIAVISELERLEYDVVDTPGHYTVTENYARLNRISKDAKLLHDSVVKPRKNSPPIVQRARENFLNPPQRYSELKPPAVSGQIQGHLKERLEAVIGRVRHVAPNDMIQTAEDRRLFEYVLKAVRDQWLTSIKGVEYKEQVELANAIAGVIDDVESCMRDGNRDAGTRICELWVDLKVGELKSLLAEYDEHIPELDVSTQKHEVLQSEISYLQGVLDDQRSENDLEMRGSKVTEAANSASDIGSFITKGEGLGEIAYQRILSRQRYRKTQDQIDNLIRLADKLREDSESVLEKGDSEQGLQRKAIAEEARFLKESLVNLKRNSDRSERKGKLPELEARVRHLESCLNGKHKLDPETIERIMQRAERADSPDL